MDNTSSTICELCEREIIYDNDTGEPSDDVECKDLSCPMLLSSTRDGGDPQPLDFNIEEGC